MRFQALGAWETLGFRGGGFRVEGLGFRVEGLGFSLGISGFLLGFRIQVLRVWGVDGWVLKVSDGGLKN